MAWASGKTLSVESKHTVTAYDHKSTPNDTGIHIFLKEKPGLGPLLIFERDLEPPKYQTTS